MRLYPAQIRACAWTDRSRARPDRLAIDVAHGHLAASSESASSSANIANPASTAKIDLTSKFYRAIYPKLMLHPGSEVAMSISVVVGYVAILIAPGFAVSALFWAADRRGLLDYVKRRQATRVRHHRALHPADVPSSTRDQVRRIVVVPPDGSMPILPWSDVDRTTDMRADPR
jgi:hypothetical protein